MSQDMEAEDKRKEREEMNDNKYLMVKLTDKPERFISAEKLAGIVTTARSAMMLVKMLGEQVADPAVTLGRIFSVLKLGTVADYISRGGHSTELQTWWDEQGISIPIPDKEEVLIDDPAAPSDKPDDVDDETLFDLVNNSLVKLPESIQELADGLFIEVLSNLPTGRASYVIEHFQQVSKFGTFGTMKTGLEYEKNTNACVVLDCSGSMGYRLGEAIANAVVHLANELKCDLILVSSAAKRLPAGTFSAETVKRNWQNAGTYYNQLVPHFKDISQSYDVVVTIADYDSIPSHKIEIAKLCKAKVHTLYDICVQYVEQSPGVAKSSFLAECLGQLAKEVKPVFVGAEGFNYTY